MSAQRNRRFAWAACATLVALIATGCSSGDAANGGAEASTSIPSSASTDPPTGSESGQDSSWLFVMRAASGTTDGTTLTLSGVDEEVLAFTDRPDRDVNRTTASTLIASWDELFDGDPPNAAVTWVGGGRDFDAAVELSNPSMDGQLLSFSYTVLTETPDRMASLIDRGATNLPAELSEINLLIDSVGSPELGMVELGGDLQEMETITACDEDGTCDSVEDLPDGQE